MCIAQAQLCAWVSILPHAEFQNLKKEKEPLALIKMLVQVSLQAIEYYKNGEFTHLDALVGNCGCEVHAFNLLTLAHSTELREECSAMHQTCQNISQWIVKRQSTLNPVEKAAQYGAVNQIYDRLQGMFLISNKMKYLIQSRLLTLTKEFVFDPTKFDEREYEISHTEASKLRSVVQPLGVQDQVLKAIVSHAQSSMSQSSIAFMRAELDQLDIANGREGLLVKRMLSPPNLCTYAPELTALQHEKRTKNHTNCPKTYSCSFYNTKALLFLLAQLQAPLIVRKMTKLNDPVQVFDFKACAEFGKFEELSHCPVGTPVIVCLAYLPDQISSQEWLLKVRRYGLGSMLLAAASQGSQYVPKKPDVFPIRDPEAAAEVSLQAEVMAKEVECVWQQGSLLDLDHFYCTTWELRTSTQLRT